MNRSHPIAARTPPSRHLLRAPRRRAGRRAATVGAALVVAGALLGAALAPPAGASDTAPRPGVRTVAVHAPHHGRTMEVVFWYPTRERPASADGALARGTPVSLGENAVFHGDPALLDAPPAAGPRPLVLLSHGLGGHALSLRWLAHGLVEAGATVLAVNHPNSTFSDFDLARGLAHWTRAEDLRHALDWLLAHPELGALVDAERIHAAGFSYGGWTALSLGGLRGNLAGYAAHCERERSRSSHCADLARGGLDLDALDAAAWNASYRDPRVRTVTAIDPALHYGLTAEHAEDLVDAVLLIGLGGEGERLPATDFGVDGSGFENEVAAEVLRIVPAFHFSALPLCKPGGAAVLEAEEDDPVCDDPPGADRAAIHRAVIAATLERIGSVGTGR